MEKEMLQNKLFLAKKSQQGEKVIIMKFIIVMHLWNLIEWEISFSRFWWNENEKKYLKSKN